MTRRLTTLFLLVNVNGILFPLFADDASRRPVEVLHTERVSLARHGTIQVLHSFGTLNVEGWDQPEAEVTVVKSRERLYKPELQVQAARALERVRIVTERRSDRELMITTTAPHKRFPRLWSGGKRGVKVEYQIRVPRDSKLIVHHGAGYVLVSNMLGDVEATSRSGDILLMLPEPGAYAIDARAKLGTVSSDFAGDAHRRHLVGSGFARATPPPSHRIYLRTLMGGITIKAVPVEAEAPVE